MTYDLVVEGGLVVTPGGCREVNVGIQEGRIAALSASSLTGRSFIDARNRVVLPGVVDLHVHFNDPGRASWEGWNFGSRAAAAGGTTTVVDMPLNASPATTSGEALEVKQSAARGKSAVDYALWGGLVDDNVAQLAELHEGGVIGFKAFMLETGVEDFRFATGEVLSRGMREIARLGSFLAVHAEDQGRVSANMQRLRGAGRTDPRAWLEAHDETAELKAIQKAVQLAAEAECPLHVVHVSLPEGVDLLREARLMGQRLTWETCAHYLTLSSDDFLRLGPVAKCAPPLRDPERREELWRRVLNGEVDCVTSDHSPCPTEMKTCGEHDIWQAWGGISGVGLLLPLMLSEGALKRGMPLEQLAELLCAAPARIAGLPGKGRLEPGADADLAIVNLDDPWVVGPEHLLSRHKHSPYLGMQLPARVEQTLLRGEVVSAHGQPRGEWLARPERNA